MNIYTGNYNAIAVMDAKYYIKKQNNIQCLLCPHQCILKDGDRGICLVRQNEGGKLIADTYGVLSAVHLDPIEKKPLYHFYPGKNILSLGSFGCNMKCKCCQNYNISQNGTTGTNGYRNVTVPQLIRQAKQDSSNAGMAYTYNEPTVWYEFMYDIAIEARNNDLKNVVVSNGYICEEPLLKLLPLIDAFNIDLKGFNAATHKKFTKANLESIKRNLVTIYNSGKHLEITHLVVPGFNDSQDEFNRLINWIKSALDTSVPLHISRYYPAYKYNEQPVNSSFLDSYYELASKHLSYVYIGNINIPGRSDTFCRNCGYPLIERSGYNINISGLDREGKCKRCRTLNINYI